MRRLGFYLSSPRTKTKEKEFIKVHNLPTMGKFKEWRLVFKRGVAAASVHPEQAMIWITKVEHAKSWQELEDNEGLSTLSAKLAQGIIEQLYGKLGQSLTLLDEQLQKTGKMLNGRQITWLL